MITNKFEIRKLVLEEIDSINKKFSNSLLINYDKLFESFKPKCQIHPNSTKISNIFWDNEYKNDMLKTNFQYPLEKVIKDFVDSKFI